MSKTEMLSMQRLTGFSDQGTTATCSEGFGFRGRRLRSAPFYELGRKLSLAVHHQDACTAATTLGRRSRYNVFAITGASGTCS